MSELSPERAVLNASAKVILALLPQMGRIMLGTQAGGATHERLGEVETVAIEGETARLSGPCHNSQIDVSQIATVIADRTGRMRDRILPKLEMQDRNGKTLFSLHALDGPDLFDKALAPFGPGTSVAPIERKPSSSPAQDVPADDLAAATFQAAHESGEPVTIEIRRAGLVQAWTGDVPAPKPAMGFVNVMSKDFHLHLMAGAVARWRKLGDAREVELHAETADGAASGLVLRGAPQAFARVPGLHVPALAEPVIHG
ncbi:MULTISPECIES: hypothetical protein [unclassified Beijerinckia]|uniref:hypothetical protein n=1 Tax=unclassified Beijerinckia TaxID=2638183 RepID=UPI00089D2346|nr:MULTISPECIES: hypothetical protein [unclassified Beijerinckia]MDH7794978.1 putative heme degradation protein [Beijerinckia sp. GAS462]SEB82678.1 Putative heme degradation protein [Beijerinckia sp. 28-YEA-48]